MLNIDVAQSPRAIHTSHSQAKTTQNSKSNLRRVLVACDLVAVVAAYLAALQLSGYLPAHTGLRERLVLGVVVPVGGILAMRSQDLYLARVSAVRAVEMSRTMRALGILAGAVLLTDRALPLEMRIRQVLLAYAFSVVLVTVGRSGYRTWLGVARQKGRYRHSVIIVGTDREAMRLVDLFDCHRDLGIDVMGCVGSRASANASGLGDLWIGQMGELHRITATPTLSGVVFTSSILSHPDLNEYIRDLQQLGLHVQVATGVSGVHSRRVRTLPIAHEPMLYVERASLSRLQLAAKRAFDLVGATIAVILLSPVLLAVAIAIRLDSKGPVLFKQRRIGMLGREFRVYKFRTMVVDAEARLAALVLLNERSGPLFKMESDPRVTRIGRFLRTSSLDELPQLINVLRGEMSLVGPRPALPSEVESFPARLRTREQVLPGITGLWQVEARDSASFAAYNRLDLFYVENWSITLDLIIVLSTVEHIISRLILRGHPAEMSGRSELGAELRASARHTDDAIARES